MVTNNKRDESVKKFANDLDRMAQLADALSLVLPNGGEVGSILGTMANDIRIVQRERPA